MIEVEDGGDNIPYKDPDYLRKYYARNRVRILKRINADHKKRKAWFNELRKGFACAGCGSNENIQFHHPNDNKKMNVAHLVVKGYSEKVIWEEIQKCVPLCKKCHDKEHGIE